MTKAVDHLRLDCKDLGRVLLVRLCEPVADPQTGEAEGVPEEGNREEERSSKDGPVHHGCLARWWIRSNKGSAPLQADSSKLRTASRDDLLTLSVHTQLTHAPSVVSFARSSLRHCNGRVE